LNSSLKPYWGKPAVRNFREGGGNTPVPVWVHVVRLLSTRRPPSKIWGPGDWWREIPPFSSSVGERKIMAHFVVNTLSR
jgi:hypothetical protein